VSSLPSAARRGRACGAEAIDDHHGLLRLRRFPLLCAAGQSPAPGEALHRFPRDHEGPEEVAIAVTIGGSAALIIIGAILRFGVTWQPAHVDLQIIGVILMIAGALGLVLSLIFMVMRRNDRRSAQVYEERRYSDPPM